MSHGGTGFKKHVGGSPSIKVYPSGQLNEIVLVSVAQSGHAFPAAGCNIAGAIQAHGSDSIVEL